MCSGRLIDEIEPIGPGHRRSQNSSDCKPGLVKTPGETMRCALADVVQVVIGIDKNAVRFGRRLEILKAMRRDRRPCRDAPVELMHGERRLHAFRYAEPTVGYLE